MIWPSNCVVSVIPKTDSLSLLPILRLSYIDKKFSITKAQSLVWDEHTLVSERKVRTSSY